MKKIHLIPIAIFLIAYNGFGQTIFELKPAQSMSITGKGAGQDAAFNPYSENTSIGIIENIGKSVFSIRVQEKGEIIEKTAVGPGETKKVQLLKGYELYLDSKMKAKARVDFKKYTD
ncbi:MAG: hypothetical protein HKP49_09180 [Maribacter sp.]|nr:hypothetical protein [Maribacter sp.]